MTVETLIASEFIAYARTKLRDNFEQIERCVALLDLDQLWHRPNEVSNAVGNLLLHLAGNVRQWIVAGLGGAPFERDRPAEFNQRDPLPAEELLAALRQTVTEADGVLDQLDDQRLSERVTIQRYELSTLAAIFHVVEHFSLHTGQIVYATKLITGRDLSLYDSQGRRLDRRRSSDVP